MWKMRKGWVFALIVAPMLVLAQTDKKDSSNSSAPPASSSSNEVAVLNTSMGQMVIEFWPDVAPKTVENFKKLARQGYFNGTLFHRVIDGFMIQGGDPNTKNPALESSWGKGGPGYRIKGETNARPDRGHVRGVISMAHSGHPDTAGSQFFICLGPAPQLDGKYTTFGKLLKGDDVLAKIGSVQVKADSRSEMSRPVKPVTLESVKIVPASEIK